MTLMLIVLLVWLIGFGISEILQWKFKVFGMPEPYEEWDIWFIHSMCAIWFHHIIIVVAFGIVMSLIWIIDKIAGD